MHILKFRNKSVAKFYAKRFLVFHVRRKGTNSLSLLNSVKIKFLFKKASLTVPLDLNYCDDNSLGLNETDLKFS